MFVFNRVFNSVSLEKYFTLILSLLSKSVRLDLCLFTSFDQNTEQIAPTLLFSNCQKGVVSQCREENTPTER